MPVKKARKKKPCACSQVKEVQWTDLDRANEAERRADHYRARAEAYREAMLILTNQYGKQA